MKEYTPSIKKNLTFDFLIFIALFGIIFFVFRYEDVLIHAAVVSVFLVFEFLKLGRSKVKIFSDRIVFNGTVILFSKVEKISLKGRFYKRLVVKTKAKRVQLADSKNFYLKDIYEIYDLLKSAVEPYSVRD